MKKIIIEIDDKQYEDAINDMEWDTLSLGIYLKELVKNGTPLEDELEKIKTEIDDYDIIEVSDSIKMGFDTMQGIALKVLDDHISELKGE